MTLQEIISLQLLDQNNESQTYNEIMVGIVISDKISELYLENKTPSDEQLEELQAYIPSQQEIDAEFISYKEILTEIETERLRIEDLKSRISALSDHNAAHSKLNPEVPNKSLWVRKNVLDNSDKAQAEDHMTALEAADAEMQLAYSSVEYKELRREEYPSSSEQMDMMYWDKVHGTSNWKTKIQEIKDKYPKPL